MKRGPVTPKGFRDILPEAAKKRREIINTIAEVLEESGFVPVETPTIEFAETLKGKYGEEEKLIYEFTDRGERQLALRYDLTVPLARFVANNLGLLAKGPFRRYQVGQVFRGENPQKGRYREFTQLDFDTVGSSTMEEDAKIIEVICKCMDKIGFKNYKVYVNDKTILDRYPLETAIVLDKLKKIGKEGVLKELVGKRQAEDYEKADRILTDIENTSESPRTKAILDKLNNSKVQFSPTLARGLNYYTGMIFEVEIEGYKSSVASGGRYDNLIGSFAGKEIPAVGGSFGLDRIIDAIEDGLK